MQSLTLRERRNKKKLLLTDWNNHHHANTEGKNGVDQVVNQEVDRLVSEVTTDHLVWSPLSPHAQPATTEALASLPPTDGPLSAFDRVFHILLHCQCMSPLFVGLSETGSTFTAMWEAHAHYATELMTLLERQYALRVVFLYDSLSQTPCNICVACMQDCLHTTYTLALFLAVRDAVVSDACVMNAFRSALLVYLQSAMDTCPRSAVGERCTYPAKKECNGRLHRHQKDRRTALMQVTDYVARLLSSGETVATDYVVEVVNAAIHTALDARAAPWYSLGSYPPEYTPLNADWPLSPTHPRPSYLDYSIPLEWPCTPLDTYLLDSAE